MNEIMIQFHTHLVVQSNDAWGWQVKKLHMQKKPNQSERKLMSMVPNLILYSKHKHNSKLYTWLWEENALLFIQKHKKLPIEWGSTILSLDP